MGSSLKEPARRVVERTFRAVATAERVVAATLTQILVLPTYARNRAMNAFRPSREDIAEVFVDSAVERTWMAYDAFWSRGPKFFAPDVAVTRAHVVRAEDLSRPARIFGPEYWRLSPYLRPGKLWAAWEYLDADGRQVRSYDGLVLFDDRWIWLPYPWLALSGALMLAPR
jgi:hypothetical protein